MGYTVKSEYWLKTEADRVEAIILMPKYWGVTWTGATLQFQLQELGITYTVDQCQEILDELVNRNVMDS
jgi:hypothetical protein